MKAYRYQGCFFAPGTQPNGSEKLDVPTDTKGLVAFLNTLIETDGLIIVGQDEVEPCREYITTGLPRSEPLEPPPNYGPREAPRITDEAFEALPLPYQLHLAALALENARGRLKP